MNAKLFYIFFKIGLFTLGGGPAMIPIVQDEVVDKKKLVSSRDFLDSVAFSSGLPGAIIVNISVFVGNKVNGLSGAIFSAVGAVLPAYFSMIVLATLFRTISSSEVVKALFMGIRPTIIILIGVSLYNIVKSTEYDKYSIYFVIAALLALVVGNISAVIVVITAGLAGVIFYSLKGIDNAK